MIGSDAVAGVVPGQRVGPGSPLLTDPAIRRDLGAFLRSTRKDTYLEAAERLRFFDRPALVLWGAGTG